MIEKKRALRREMRMLRSSCSDRSELDRRISEHFLKSGIYRNTNTLLIYASFGTEADTFKVIESAIADQKAVYLPRCAETSNQMEFYRVSSVAELHPGTFGIAAPEEDEKHRFADGEKAVCIVPGLAFTKQGKRLGYGRGYYDTYLEKIDVCTVGFCYGFQVVSDIPTETHDKRMQFLCTEQGLRRCEGD